MNEASIQSRFEAFHAANPAVYAELVAMCRKARAAGYRTVGIKMLWEVLRWNRLFTTKSDDEFKLNNYFTSRYARLITQREPDLADIFELRELQAP